MCIILNYLVFLQIKAKELSSLEEQFEVLKWEYEVLQVRFDRILGERDQLKCRYSEAVQEVQQKAALKSALLHFKAKDLKCNDMRPREIAVSHHFLKENFFL